MRIPLEPDTVPFKYWLLLAVLIWGVHACQTSKAPSSFPEKASVHWIFTPTAQPSVEGLVLNVIADRALDAGELHLKLPEQDTTIALAPFLDRTEEESPSLHTYRVPLPAEVCARTHRYRIASQQGAEDWQTFPLGFTAENDSFEMLYLGDAQNGIASRCREVLALAAANFPRAELALHAGDLINHAGAKEEWQQWRESAQPLHCNTIAIATPGNHEYIKNAEGKKVGFSPFWDQHFTFPSNGLPQLGNQNYYLDYKSCRIICLDSNKALDEQAEWLENLLQRTDSRWVILLFHHPIYSGAEERFNKGIHEKWLPLLKRYGVDLVLQGHDHTYARGRCPDVEDREESPVFVISVIGSKYYPLAQLDWMERSYAEASTYQHLHLSDSALTYRAFDRGNRLIDHFRISKDGQSKRKFEALPLPEEEENLTD